MINLWDPKLSSSVIRLEEMYIYHKDIFNLDHFQRQSEVRVSV